MSLSPRRGVASKLRKVQGTSVPAGGLGEPPRFKSPPLLQERGTQGVRYKTFGTSPLARNVVRWMVE